MRRRLGWLVAPGVWVASRIQADHARRSPGSRGVRARCDAGLRFRSESAVGRSGWTCGLVRWHAGPPLPLPADPRRVPAWQTSMRPPSRRSGRFWCSTTAACWSPTPAAASRRSSAVRVPARAARSRTVKLCCLRTGLGVCSVLRASFAALARACVGGGSHKLGGGRLQLSEHTFRDRGARVRVRTGAERECSGLLMCA